MFSFFKIIKNFISYRNNIRLTSLSLYFDDTFNKLPNLEFEYTLEKSYLKIFGPSSNLYNIKEYALLYDIEKDIIIFNEKTMNKYYFWFIYKAVRTTYKKLLKRKEFFDSVNQNMKKIKKNFPTLDDFNKVIQSTDIYSIKLNNLNNNRSSDLNTDVLCSDDFDSGNDGSSSRSQFSD